MRGYLAATSVGSGVLEALAEPGGQVVGLFSSGFYVRAGASVFAVGGPALPRGPLHLVVEHAPPAPPEGVPVFVRPGHLRVADCDLLLHGATPYETTIPSAAQLAHIAPVLARNLAEIRPPDDLAGVWPAARTAVFDADLHQALQLLQGRGGGLTPTGDDVLAALLLFAHWVDPKSPIPTELAARAETTALSRTFLRWSAVGQSIEPVHDLLDSALRLGTAGSGAPAHAKAIAALAAIGGSSGKAMLTGLGLAASAWMMRTSRPAPGQGPRR